MLPGVNLLLKADNFTIQFLDVLEGHARREVFCSAMRAFRVVSKALIFSWVLVLEDLNPDCF